MDGHALGAGRLRQLIRYGRDVYGLKERLGEVRDSRRDPTTTAPWVAAAVMFCGLLRIRSFNALEPRLRERTFVRLAGAPEERERLCSADTLGRSLRRMDLGSVREVTEGVIAHSERNKVFRDGWIGAMRYVALDGWEPIRSEKKHCRMCLKRQVHTKTRSGELEGRDEYYHRFAAAMLIDDRFDLALGIEPVLPNDLRADGKEDSGKDEGELTAGRRLLRHVKETFGWVDVVVADGLYPNGPFLTEVRDLGMGAVVVLRKESDEPLKEALAIWGESGPAEVLEDAEAKERIELWDCPGVETLGTYAGPIRVVRARVTRLDDPAATAKTWCFAVTGKAMRLSARQVVRVGRGRWHIENTAFHQWTTRWHFAHVFVRDGHGLLALYWLFLLAFNLLTLFLYRQLRSYGRDRGREVTRTISRLVDEMLDDLVVMTESPWNTS